MSAHCGAEFTGEGQSDTRTAWFIHKRISFQKLNLVWRVLKIYKY